MNAEVEIIQRLTELKGNFDSLEKQQSAFQERNEAEHQEIMAHIEELKSDGKDTHTTNGAQNNRLTKLETAFEAHVKEEAKDRNSYMWRFGIIITLIVFAGDIISKFFV